MESILETKQLCKVYKMGENEVHALREVDLDIKRGEFVAIMGTSGSGKSTLLHMLGCLDVPTSGEVILDGKSLEKMKDKQLSKVRREKIGYVFQQFCLIQELTVWENIILPVLLDSKKPDEEYIKELCETLGLGDRLDHKPFQLSGGQQQRAAIARALANNPELVLCDEPTGNLDKATGEDVVALLKLIHEKYGRTVVIVTHDETVAASADRILKIEDGRIA